MFPHVFHVSTNLKPNTQVQSSYFAYLWMGCFFCFVYLSLRIFVFFISVTFCKFAHLALVDCVGLLSCINAWDEETGESRGC